MRFPDPVKYSLGTLCLATGLVTLRQAAPWWQRLFAWRPLTMVGVVSYSIYVWQEPFGEIDDRLIRLACLPLAVVCGLLSYRFVEQPARRALNRLWAPGPRAPVGPEASAPGLG